MFRVKKTLQKRLSFSRSRDSSRTRAMPKYELCYFSGRGRGEHIRYLLHHVGQTFEDSYIEWNDWPTVKDDYPFGALPVLKVNGKTLPQCVAIARYIANQHGIAGKTDWERALADAYVDGIHGDLYPHYLKVYLILVMGGPKEKAMEEFVKFKTDHLDLFLKRYEKILAENGSGYLVGKELTWADIVLGELLQRFQSLWDAKVLMGYPNLQKIVEMVHELPNIKKYVASRPPTYV